jgi:hypothetical protein
MTCIVCYIPVHNYSLYDNGDIIIPDDNDYMGRNGYIDPCIRRGVFSLVIFTYLQRAYVTNNNKLFIPYIKVVFITAIVTIKLKEYPRI